MIHRLSTDEIFRTRKEAKQSVGGKWAFERLVKQGDLKFIKMEEIVASDDLHDNRKADSRVS